MDFLAAEVGWLEGVKDGDSTLNAFFVLPEVSGKNGGTEVVLGTPAAPGARISGPAIYLLVCLGGRVLVLVMVEGASLVLVATISVDEDVATKCLLALYAPTVSWEHPRNLGVTDLAPWIWESRPDAAAHSRPSIASRP